MSKQVGGFLSHKRQVEEVLHDKGEGKGKRGRAILWVGDLSKELFLIISARVNLLLWYKQVMLY